MGLFGGNKGTTASLKSAKTFHQPSTVTLHEWIETAVNRNLQATKKMYINSAWMRLYRAERKRLKILRALSPWSGII